jgi:hypothetical protein
MTFINGSTVKETGSIEEEKMLDGRSNEHISMKNSVTKDVNRPG